MSEKCTIDETSCYSIKKVEENVNELRKQNSATHERIFERLDNIEDKKNAFNPKEMEDDLNEIRKQNSSSHERIFDRLNNLEKKSDLQEIQYKHILEKIEEISSDLHEIKAKPGKRMDAIIEKIIMLIVAAIVGYFLAKLGLQV